MDSSPSGLPVSTTYPLYEVSRLHCKTCITQGALAVCQGLIMFNSCKEVSVDKMFVIYVWREKSIRTQEGSNVALRT